VSLAEGSLRTSTLTEIVEWLAVCAYRRAKEEEEIHRRSSACSRCPPALLRYGLISRVA